VGSFCPFLFVRIFFFFPCMSRYVNHAICMVYKVLGAIALFYGIYLLPGLMQPFSTAVWLTSFSFYITCRILCPNLVPWGFIELLRKHDGLNVQSLSLFLDEPLCQPYHSVGITQSCVGCPVLQDFSHLD
jgi:hypothetical protein